MEVVGVRVEMPTNQPIVLLAIRHDAQMAPTLLILDSEMQDQPLPEHGKKPAIPKLSRMAPVSGDQNALAECAQMLVNAENPVIVADRNTRTQAGIDRLVELAETLHVPVCDMGGRMNFPTGHKYNLSERARALVAQADLILGLEMIDFYNTTHAFHDNIESYSRCRSCRAPPARTSWST